jgi:hypothetical protein
MATTLEEWGSGRTSFGGPQATVRRRKGSGDDGVNRRQLRGALHMHALRVLRFWPSRARRSDFGTLNQRAKARGEVQGRVMVAWM